MIDNDILIIKYGKGTITIYMPEFFPAPQDKVRKLFKSVIGAMLWDERQQTASEILAWLKRRRDSMDVEEQRLRYASSYTSNETKLHELEEKKAKQSVLADNLKHYAKQLNKSGKEKFKAEKLDPALEDLKQLKAQITALKKQIKEDQRTFYDLEAAHRKLEANIALVAELVTEHGYGGTRW